MRFSDALNTVSEEGFGLILEVGPARVLSVLTRQQGLKNPMVSVPSLDIESGKSEYHAVLKAMGQLWLNGIEPDWNIFYKSQCRNRITLPAYAFV